MRHPLTREQAEAVDVFMTRQCMRTIAYAGAGKTSTLVAMANRAVNRRGLYIAFNKAIATEASTKFPISVNCSTAHSLAYRAVKQCGFSDDQLRTPLNTRSIQHAGIRIETVGNVSQFSVAQLITAAIRRFCHSADAQVENHHVSKPRKPMEGVIKVWSDEQGRYIVEPDGWRYLRGHVVAGARELWNLMIDVGNPIPLGHDGYLKVWQLNSPRLSTDVIFVDEAQDLNPVLVDVIARQIYFGAQVVSVGDKHQAIYGWRGAVDALEILPGQECRLTQSFRFGEHIAWFANRLLWTMGEEVPLRGNGRADSWVGDSDGLASAILCRTNSGVITRASRLMSLSSKIHVPGGVGELISLVDDADRLLDGKPAQTIDLLGFNRWSEVVEYAETDDGADLKVFVSLVDEHGPSDLRRILGQVISRPTPDSVTISTAHKAKGLEWDDVELNDDFRVTGRDIAIEDRRLFYVAATRAKHQLMVSDDLAATFTTR